MTQVVPEIKPPSRGETPASTISTQQAVEFLAKRVSLLEGTSGSTSLLSGLNITGKVTATGNLKYGLKYARIYNSANIAAGTGALTALTFDRHLVDTAGFHSFTTNPGRLTLPEKGAYLIGGNVKFALPGVPFEAYLLIRKGGTPFWGSQYCYSPGVAAFMDISATTVVTGNAGEYFELVVFQNSGAPLNVLTDHPRSPEFWIMQIPTSTIAWPSIPV